MFFSLSATSGGASQMGLDHLFDLMTHVVQSDDGDATQLRVFTTLHNAFVNKPSQLDETILNQLTTLAIIVGNKSPPEQPRSDQAQNFTSEILEILIRAFQETSDEKTSSKYKFCKEAIEPCLDRICSGLPGSSLDWFMKRILSLFSEIAISSVSAGKKATRPISAKYMKKGQSGIGSILTPKSYISH